jgi:hypothetical protein
MTSKLLFASKKTVVEPPPSSGNDSTTPPIDKKFSALLGNRKASSSGSSSATAAAVAVVATPVVANGKDNKETKSVSVNDDDEQSSNDDNNNANNNNNNDTNDTVDNQQKSVDSVTPVSSTRDRSNENEYAALFALAAGASKSALEAALPKEPLARRALVASARDKQQQTLLHVVVEPAIAQFLVGDCAADVAAKDRKGTTPLHLAAKAASASLCNKLIELVSSSLRLSALAAVFPNRRSW